ncbi:ATP-binding protein [Fimbriiglobus ruber]|uniref:histidine kinase n=1 Tax=Fimbriiglobus ruber TaxID=1908690 RepID=A0A225E0F8_9BACT|nr:ATP-binding protein [Fimbriiglobus ruber]OWK43486.1 Sensor histidine kinase [Fimbriiglobus ruber]
MPKLIVLSGPDAGKQFPLTGPTVTVGRHSGNAVHLNDNRTSRRHLELRVTISGGYQLFDLQSGNGTQVNGRHVQVIDLRPGDRIELGDTVLQYAADGSEIKTREKLDTTPATHDRTRLIVRPTTEYPSAILRTVAADVGEQILARPDQAGTDWLRARLANLAVMYEAASAVSQILDVDELLGRITDLVVRTTDADHGCVMLSDPDTGELMPKTVRSRASSSGGDFVVSRTVVDHVLRTGQGVLVADAGADERFRGGESIARHQIREVICVPMKGRHETVGVLFLDTSATAALVSLPLPLESVAGPGASKFSEDHLRLAVAIAHQAGLAVEETRYYQAMVQAERLAAVGQTIAALSHHIKNIMQGVRFGSDMVRMGLADDDRALLVKGWRLVEKNQVRIDELILDMLSYSKDREPAVERTDVNGLAEEVLDVVRGRAADRGVALEWHPAVGLPLVPCDPEGIHRALLNIVTNALDATEGAAAPRVTVTTELAAGGAYAEISVTDNGPGIPAERVADMFKPFVSTKGSKGTGLGLPVSRKILREHGGDVLVETAEGRGSRFILRIPMAVAEGPTKPLD